MGRDLTKRYSLLFEKGGVKNPFLFFHDVYKFGKVREFVSFIVWELLHQFSLFPKSRYLKFNNSQALTLDNERLHDSSFKEKIDRFFATSDLNVVTADHNWKLLFINKRGQIFGCLYPDDRGLYKSTDHGESVVFLQRFPQIIRSLFISSQDTLFVCVKGAVYRSSDKGGSFQKCLDLGSSESFFRHNNGMTETPGQRLIIGEYGNVWNKTGWKKLAYLYFSSDNGETWKRSDFLIGKGTNKHVHVVRYSPLLNKLLMADGDNKKKLWISDSLDSFGLDPEWKAVNKLHIQMGGYTAIAENDGKIWFGTDYQGGTNFIVETEDGKKFTKKIVPDPYRRSPIDNMVLRKSKNGTEIWANLPFSTAGTKCLLMYTADGGRTWKKVVEYSRATHTVWLLNSSNEIADELYFSVENLRNGNRVVYKIADRQ